MSKLRPCASSRSTSQHNSHRAARRLPGLRAPLATARTCRPVWSTSVRMRSVSSSFCYQARSPSCDTYGYRPWPLATRWTVPRHGLYVECEFRTSRRPRWGLRAVGPSEQAMYRSRRPGMGATHRPPRSRKRRNLAGTSSRECGLTFTSSPRNTRHPNMRSRSRRASTPMRLIISPPLPTMMPFWPSRSTYTVACRRSRSRLGAQTRRT